MEMPILSITCATAAYNHSQLTTQDPQFLVHLAQKKFTFAHEHKLSNEMRLTEYLYF